MFNFFEKTIAFLISILVMIFGLPSDSNPVNPPDDIQSKKIEIISNDWDLNTTGKYVFDNFADLGIYCFTVNRSNRMKEYADSLGEDFFDENNLVIVDVALADTAEKAFVASAVENGNTLNLQYYKKDIADMGACVICYDSICIKVSKNITKINAVETIAPIF